MKRVQNRGNLPKHLQVLAGQLGGRLNTAADTEFYEANSIKEFEKKAVDIGYEIVPTIDNETARGFLVGFDVKEPERIATLLSYAAMQIYFVECTTTEVEEWSKKMQQHRLDQQEDMRHRQEKAKAKHAKNPMKIIK